jgi:hypothetical protein
VLWNLLQVYLAALRWAISSLLMLYLVWGSQTQLLYSNFGRIKDVYAFFLFHFFLHRPIGENCNVPHCKEKFDTFTEYMKRWNKIHISEINIYDCQLCKIRFRKALRAKKHVKSVHRNVTDIVITTVIVNKYSLIIRLIMHSWQSYIFISLIWILFQRFIYSVKVSNFSLQCGTLQFSPIGLTPTVISCFRTQPSPTSNSISITPPADTEIW